MEFTSKVMPVVKSHLESVMSIQPKSVDLFRELLEADEQELQQRAQASSLQMNASSSSSSTSTTTSSSQEKSHHAAFKLKASSSDLKTTVNAMQKYTVDFIARCKVEVLKKGSVFRTVRPDGTQLDGSFSYVCLSDDEQELQWGTQESANIVPTLTQSIQLKTFNRVCYGNQCALFSPSSSSSLSSSCEWKDKCIQLSDGSTQHYFVFETHLEFCHWVDGIKAVLGKPMETIAEDLRALLSAQMLARRFDLEDLQFDRTKAPAVPPLPPNYDFATDEK